MIVDHLLYGTLPDTPGSQHVIAKSPGISFSQEAWLINYYDQFGDCRDQGFAKSLSVFWYRDQPDQEKVIVTQVSHHGKDFSGRWGALLRHSVVLSAEQYKAINCLPDRIEQLLLTSVSSDQLALLKESSLDLPEDDPESIPDCLMTGDFYFEDFRQNLTALLKGQRLVLFAERNTDWSDRCVRRLVSLLPVRWRQVFNWSEFVFRTSENLDLSLVYSSRHEAPQEGRLTFAAVGDNHIRDLGLEPAYVEDYVSRLSEAIASQNSELLTQLFLEP